MSNNAYINSKYVKLYGIWQTEKLENKL